MNTGGAKRETMFTLIFAAVVVGLLVNGDRVNRARARRNWQSVQRLRERNGRGGD